MYTKPHMKVFRQTYTFVVSHAHVHVFPMANRNFDRDLCTSVSQAFPVSCLLKRLEWAKIYKHEFLDVIYAVESSIQMDRISAFAATKKDNLLA